MDEATYWRLKFELAEVRQLVLIRHARELIALVRKYDPNQPRVPAGRGRESGRWMRDGGWTLPTDRSLGVGSRRPRYRPPQDGGARVLRRTDAEAARTPTDEILRPGGRPVGYAPETGRPGYQTVTRDEFKEISRQLKAGARGSTQPGYDGQVFERADGIRFGLRNSGRHDATIDIFRDDPLNAPFIRRIHQHVP